LNSSGQVTDRTLHLSAFNCVLAVIAFKIVMGYGALSGAGSVFVAFWNSLVVLLVSASLGALFGVVVPALLRALGGTDRRVTVAFALSVLALTALTHSLKFSPLLAALAFGLVARHRRIILSQAQRNFGALGDLLTVLLFVFVAATLDWNKVVSGMWLALAVIAVRTVVKVTVTTLFARLSGITWRKGALTGLALTPQSVFAILLLEQSRHLDLDLMNKVAAIAAIVLLLDVIGPLVTRRALVWAGEVSRDGGN
jgi:Kef-type K+ transport system membrane component KefB